MLLLLVVVGVVAFNWKALDAVKGIIPPAISPSKIDEIFARKTITINDNGQQRQIPLGEFIVQYNPENGRLTKPGGMSDIGSGMEHGPRSEVLEASPPQYKVRYAGKGTFMVDMISETVEPVDDAARKIMAAEGQFFKKSSSSFPFP